MLVSRRKKFMLDKNTSVVHIRVLNKKFIHNLVKKKVDIRYEKLLKDLTLLLITDQIERFRQEIKNKYKLYLTRKELDKMAKQLVHMQKEAHMKMIIAQNARIFDLPIEDSISVGRRR